MSDALRDFMAARIGGEAQNPYDTDDGTLLTDTSVQAAAVVGALLDSPAITPHKARLLTRLLRGAVLTVYTLVHTLSTGGARRGLGLLVLATGGALIAIDLLTGETPAWLTTAGFGILLGGLAYAAVMSRMWVHALVLATPAVPLTVWALTLPEDPAAAGERGGQLVVISGMVLMLLAVGSVRRHVHPPHRVLLDGARRGWGALLRWVVPGLAVLALVVAGLLVRAALHAAVPAALDRFALALALAGVVAGVAVAAPRRIGASSPRQRAAAQWAWTYGAGYAVAAVVLAGLTPFATGDRTLWGVSLPRPPDWLGSIDATRWTDPLAATLTVLALACFTAALLLPALAVLRSRSS